MKLWNRDIILIIILGLVIRLIILPYSQTVHADAVSRIIHAQEWLANPKYIFSAVWGPLNQYLFAFSIKFLGGKIYGPKIINILFAVFTAYPLYWFTQNVFKTRAGSIAVAVIYIISPIVIRNSFQALPAIPFGFFIALSMYHLSNYIAKNNIKYLFFSAIAINMAGALRYEAWIITLFFGFILLLNKKYRAFFIFGAIASIFPISWVLGCYYEQHDWLYSFHYSTEWAANEIAGINDINQIDLLKRILFFPYSIFIICGPLLACLLIYIIPASVIKKRITKNELIWIIPFFSLFSIYTYKAIHGSLLLQNKYTISLLILLLPFASLLFVNQKGWRTVLSYLSILLIIPSSYVLDSFPWKKALRFSSTLSIAMDDLIMDNYNETKMIPLLTDKDFYLIRDLSNNSYQENDGVITDFLGWENTYYFSLHSKKTPFIITGTEHEPVPFVDLQNYFNEYPNGLILFSYFGKLLPFTKGKGQIVKIENIKNDLYLTPIFRKNGYMLFRYEYLDNNSIVLHDSDKSVLSFNKDVAYFEAKIKNDHHWLQTIKQQAEREDKNLDTLIRENAEYCYSMGYD